MLVLQATLQALCALSRMNLVADPMAKRQSEAKISSHCTVNGAGFWSRSLAKAIVQLRRMKIPNS